MRRLGPVSVLVRRVNDYSSFRVRSRKGVRLGIGPDTIAVMEFGWLKLDKDLAKRILPGGSFPFE